MAQQGPRLRGQLGFFDTVAVALGSIIGAGIFVAIGQGARLAGAGLPIAILIAGMVAAFSGLSSAELGVNYPRAGGAYEFGYHLLRPVLGFIAGLAYLLGNLAGGAALSLTFAGYLQPLVPWLPLRAVAVGLSILLLGVNLAGVQQSRLLNDALVIFKVLVLVIFVFVGLAAVSQWQASSFSPLSWSGLLQASGLLFFAFTGYSRPVTIVEEIRNPTRILPPAMVTALAISTALYLSIGIVGLGLVGAEGLSSSSAPLLTALAPTGQVWAQLAVLLGGLVATADVLLTDIWGLSRMLFAMARRGDLPGILGRVSPGGIPRPAVLIAGTIVILLSLAANLGSVLAASSLGLLVYYAIMNSAALRLNPRQRLYPPVIPLAGLISCAALAFSLPAESLIIVGAVVGMGAIYFILRHRHRSPPGAKGCIIGGLSAQSIVPRKKH